MRAFEPVDDAPLRILCGSMLATAARVAQLSSLLRATEARQPRAATQSKAKASGKAAKSAPRVSHVVHSIQCGPRGSAERAGDGAAGKTAQFPSAACAVGRAVKVKLDDGKWYARLRLPAFCQRRIALGANTCELAQAQGPHRAARRTR